MSEYLYVEKPFLDQLEAMGWTVIDQGQGIIPSDPAVSLRASFRQWILPDVFSSAVRSINLTDSGELWLTDRQLDDLRDQILRHPRYTLFWKPMRPCSASFSRHRSTSTSSRTNTIPW